jgi:2-octaprenyl-6-methoxyphenol hydroxylase
MAADPPTPAFDVCILGDGPVGCALALALQGSALSVAWVGSTQPADARHTGGAAQAALRPIALSYASRLILERIGAWQGLRCTAIEAIDVSEAGAFGRTHISRGDLSIPALGYVTGYDDIAPAIAAAITPLGLAIFPRGEAPPARLVVHAEGTPGTAATGKDYHQEAVVAQVRTEPPARGTAYERFTREGPLALLPCGDAYGLVWSRTAGRAGALLQASEAGFLAQLQEAFGHRAGRFVEVGERAAFPLALRYRPERARAGEISIGNAAQTLHPVAGQGLNLGLRDAWELACRLRAAQDPQAIASAAFADAYARSRRLDTRSIIGLTDLLATLFVRRGLLPAAFRSSAMTLLDLLPPARRLLARRMVFGASAWP